MVTFGITPSRPDTGYGYICRGTELDGIPGCYHIARFVEKPDQATAASYLASGTYAWNSGMFLFSVQAYLAEVARFKPDMLECCRRALAEAASDLDFLRLAKAAFASAESISVDYAVMEHTDKGVIVPADLGWSDVGCWSALWEIADHDGDGNVTSGDVITLDVHNSYIRGDGNLIAAIGVRDLVVVATGDVVLVVPKGRDQDVKKLVEQIEKAGRTEHYIHMRVFRPWGWYQLIDKGSRFQVKQIVVNPGHKLSTQMHFHRAEHWIVVSGTARVMRGDETFYLTENQSTYIPHNVTHCLENPGKLPLCLIEVQSGSYLGEDDILRFNDHYGRAGT
jgi:mannose-1-phosphate guanylyltransferase/mannose-6-phosphate isomerase